MTTKEIGLSVALAIFWTVFMIWWSSDHSTANIVLLSVLGLLFGFGWVWVMKRFGYLR